MKGSESNDIPYLDGDRVRFETNNAGGMLGGISNGEDIVMRMAVKPTPTVSVPQQTVDMEKMEETTLGAITRRDPDTPLADHPGDRGYDRHHDSGPTNALASLRQHAGISRTSGSKRGRPLGGLGVGVRVSNIRI